MTAAAQLAFPLDCPAPPLPKLETGRSAAGAGPPRLHCAGCALSRDGAHLVIDLSQLRYLPSAPFCAWCGPLFEAANRQSNAEAAD